MGRKAKDMILAMGGLIVVSLLLTLVTRSISNADFLAPIHALAEAIDGAQQRFPWALFDDEEAYADIAMPPMYEESHNAWTEGTSKPVLVGPVRPVEYPMVALRNGWEGTATVHFTIDETGEPFDCRLGESSGHDVLDKASCLTVMLGAKFTPARDAHGKSVMTGHHLRITWRLEE